MPKRRDLAMVKIATAVLRMSWVACSDYRRGRPYSVRK